METPSEMVHLLKKKNQNLKNAAGRTGENSVLEKSLILRKILQFVGQVWKPDRKRLPLF